MSECVCVCVCVYQVCVCARAHTHGICIKPANFVCVSRAGSGLHSCIQILLVCISRLRLRQPRQLVQHGTLYPGGVARDDACRHGEEPLRMFRGGELLATGELDDARRV